MDKLIKHASALAGFCGTIALKVLLALLVGLLAVAILCLFTGFGIVLGQVIMLSFSLVDIVPWVSWPEVLGSIGALFGCVGTTVFCRKNFDSLTLRG